MGSRHPIRTDPIARQPFQSYPIRNFCCEIRTSPIGSELGSDSDLHTSTLKTCPFYH